MLEPTIYRTRGEDANHYVTDAVFLEVNYTCISLWFTRSGLEPRIYRTRGDHFNHYATDVVTIYWLDEVFCI